MPLAAVPPPLELPELPSSLPDVMLAGADGTVVLSGIAAVSRLALQMAVAAALSLGS